MNKHKNSLEPTCSLMVYKYITCSECNTFVDIMMQLNFSMFGNWPVQHEWACYSGDYRTFNSFFALIGLEWLMCMATHYRTAYWRLAQLTPKRCNNPMLEKKVNARNIIWCLEAWCQWHDWTSCIQSTECRLWRMITMKRYTAECVSTEGS